MKKAKVIVTALAVFAVVGGALAFKAKNANYCYYTKDSHGTCALVGNISAFTTATTGTAAQKEVTKSGDCPTTQSSCDQTITSTSTNGL